MVCMDTIFYLESNSVLKRHVSRLQDFRRFNLLSILMRRAILQGLWYPILYHCFSYMYAVETIC